MSRDDTMSSAEGTAEASASVGLDVLYRRLRAICGSRLSSESIDHTLQATALANEVWLRLHELDPVAAANPAKSTRWFVANAVVAIRQVLIDHARRRLRLKRGGGRARVELDGDAGASGAVPDQDASERILAANELLNELAAAAPRQADIVVLRFFGGLTFRQIALHTGQSEPAVRREWAMARVWLGSRPAAAGWFDP